MGQFIRHPLTLSVLTILALYTLFAFVLQPPLPRSLLIQFMVFCAIGILMVATFDDASAERFFEPVKNLFGNPAWQRSRMLAHGAFVILVTGVAGNIVLPDDDAPLELRSVHPAPPSAFSAWGKTYELQALTNPFRGEVPAGSSAMTALIDEGSDLYFKNCVLCHGALLDGRGQYSSAYSPRPTNFQDSGTIAQLQESYVFWRIATGAVGLPREGAPWSSVMPAWKEMLAEDDIWKIILFLYDYTQQEPRIWKHDGTPSAQQAASSSGGRGSERNTETLYRKYCAPCHGRDGEGNGPGAAFMLPRPRDFSIGLLRYKTTGSKEEFPSDEDLHRVISDGLKGTAMPGWSAFLSDDEIEGLIEKIKVFGLWEGEDHEPVSVDMSGQIASSEQSIKEGWKLYEKTCQQCHGEQGRGNITSGKKLKDDWQDRIWPRNLTHPEFWRATDSAEDIFVRMSTGMPGTPMPEHTAGMSAGDRWRLANYVESLRGVAVPFSSDNRVVRATRLARVLPDSPQDPLWQHAQPVTFRLSPNLVSEPRLFGSLNDTVTVRALYNDDDIVFRLDIDDRTYSVPGDPLELQYRIAGQDVSRDAAAIQFSLKAPVPGGKPAVSHSGRRQKTLQWYWQAPSKVPAEGAGAAILTGSAVGAPVMRQSSDGFAGAGTWAEGRWQIMFKRPLLTLVEPDVQFEPGRFFPISFANWDGVNGETGSRHSFTSWQWLLLVPEPRPVILYGVPVFAGFLAFLLFWLAVRRQNRKFRAFDEAS